MREVKIVGNKVKEHVFRNLFEKDRFIGNYMIKKLKPVLGFRHLVKDHIE